jgi:hypothetical protein
MVTEEQWNNTQWKFGDKAQNINTVSSMQESSDQFDNPEVAHIKNVWEELGIRFQD